MNAAANEPVEIRAAQPREKGFAIPQRRAECETFQINTPCPVCRRDLDECRCADVIEDDEWPGAWEG